MPTPNSITADRATRQNQLQDTLKYDKVKKKAEASTEALLNDNVKRILRFDMSLVPREYTADEEHRIKRCGIRKGRTALAGIKARHPGSTAEHSDACDVEVLMTLRRTSKSKGGFIPLFCCLRNPRWTPKIDDIHGVMGLHCFLASLSVVPIPTDVWKLERCRAFLRGYWVEAWFDRNSDYDNARAASVLDMNERHTDTVKQLAFQLWDAGRKIDQQVECHAQKKSNMAQDKPSQTQAELTQSQKKSNQAQEESNESREDSNQVQEDSAPALAKSTKSQEDPIRS